VNHPVLILTHNNLELTKRTVESVFQQGVATRPSVIDNGSTDGTVQWLDNNGLLLARFPDNHGVSAGWNLGLTLLLAEAEHCLVIGNDVVLPHWFYRHLLSYNLPFVTGVAVNNFEQVTEPTETLLTPNPDFSAFLIRRECWQKVGQFNERMKHYCSDCDMHIRAHRLGVPMMKASVAFYHERSSTIRLASPAEQGEIQAQANADREVFKSIYNCLPGSKDYESIFL